MERKRILITATSGNDDSKILHVAARTEAADLIVTAAANIWHPGVKYGDSYHPALRVGVRLTPIREERRQRS